ncbi:hypothetical protein QTP88_001190 [Uroleucon formosanum]
MIKKCTVINYVDGTNYDIKIVAGPFVHNIEFIFHTIFGKRKSSKKSGKNIFQLYIAAARGTTGENSLMLYDLISVSHSSSSISKSTSKILIKNGCLSNFSNQESAVSHSSPSSSSIHFDNLNNTKTSSTEVGPLLSDTITESYSKSESTPRIMIKNSKFGPNTYISPFFSTKSNTVFNITNINVCDNFDSTLNNGGSNNANTTDLGLMDLSNFISKNENCCCQNLLEIKLTLATNEKTSKAVHKQMMIQLHMLNNSNVKIVNAMKNMDQKLQVIMKADSKMSSLALPIPVFPTALITLLPVKFIEEVDVVESILSDDVDGLNNQEELNSYLYMKIGSMDSIRAAVRGAIKECFKYNVLDFFSFKGKTKQSLSTLMLCTVIYESLSSFRNHPKDKEKFIRAVDNYIKHSIQRE